MVGNRLDFLEEVATMSAIPDAVSAAPDIYRMLWRTTGSVFRTCG
jgi:hypothetical protein